MQNISLPNFKKSIKIFKKNKIYEIQKHLSIFIGPVWNRYQTMKVLCFGLRVFTYSLIKALNMINFIQKKKIFYQ